MTTEAEVSPAARRKLDLEAREKAAFEARQAAFSTSAPADEVEKLQRRWLEEAWVKAGKHKKFTSADIIPLAAEIAGEADDERIKQLSRDRGLLDKYAKVGHPTPEWAALQDKFKHYNPDDDPVYAATKPFLSTSGAGREKLEAVALDMGIVSKESLGEAREAQKSATWGVGQALPRVRATKDKPIDLKALEREVKEQQDPRIRLDEETIQRARIAAQADVSELSKAPARARALAVGETGDTARGELAETRRQEAAEAREQQRRYEEQAEEMTRQFHRGQEESRRKQLESVAKDRGTTVDALLVEEAAQEDREGHTDSGRTVAELRQVWDEAGQKGEMPRHWYRAATDLSNPFLKMSIGGEQAYLRQYNAALQDYTHAVEIGRTEGTVARKAKALESAYYLLLEKQSTGKQAFLDAGLAPPPPLEFKAMPEAARRGKWKPTTPMPSEIPTTPASNQELMEKASQQARQAAIAENKSYPAGDKKARRRVELAKQRAKEALQETLSAMDDTSVRSMARVQVLGGAANTGNVATGANAAAAMGARIVNEMAREELAKRRTAISTPTVPSPTPNDAVVTLPPYEVVDRDDPLPGYDLGHDADYRKAQHRYADLYKLETEARDKVRGGGLSVEEQKAWEERYFALRAESTAAIAATDVVEARLLKQSKYPAMPQQAGKDEQMTTAAAPVEEYEEDEEEYEEYENEGSGMRPPEEEEERRKEAEEAEKERKQKPPAPPGLDISDSEAQEMADDVAEIAEEHGAEEATLQLKDAETGEVATLELKEPTDESSDGDSSPPVMPEPESVSGSTPELESESTPEDSPMDALMGGGSDSAQLMAETEADVESGAESESMFEPEQASTGDMSESMSAQAAASPMMDEQEDSQAITVDDEPEPPSIRDMMDSEPAADDAPADPGQIQFEPEMEPESPSIRDMMDAEPATGESSVDPNADAVRA